MTNTPSSEVKVLIRNEYGEPPPITPEEQHWINKVHDEIMCDDKTTCYKPKIATLVFDNKTRPINFHDNEIYSEPFNWRNCSTNEYEDPPMAYQTPSEFNNNTTNDPYYDDEELIHGEIATGKEMEKESTFDDPVLNVLKTTILGTKKWIPRLPHLNEENAFDVKFEDQVNTLYQPTSRKRRQACMRRMHSKQKEINQIIQHGNGLYRGEIKMQKDSGANRSVTSYKNLLLNLEQIAPYPMGGVKENETAIYCTAKGYLPWHNDDGELFLVRCYYCKDVEGTILSPTNLTEQYEEQFYGWNFTANLDNGIGQLSLLSRDGVNHSHFTSYKENNLWYHYFEKPSCTTTSGINQAGQAIIKKLTDGAAYELWHNRLGHPGNSVMDRIHTAVRGIPKLRRNQFYSCNACMASKFKKSHIGKTKSYVKDGGDINNDDSIGIGQHLHMDFGFVRGSEWSKKDNDGKLVTSIDNFRSYLLVINKASRYIWIFLTKTKSPLIKQVEGLLAKFRNQYNYCTVTTDLGKELGTSNKFREAIANGGYTLKTTGAHSSAQNGLAEKPNQDLARMMRSLLFGAGLSSKYWSYALRHAVSYLKNRLPHASLKWITPYTKVNGHPPDLSRLRTFGSRVSIHNGNKRKAKLDDISSVGTFMTYKGTDKIICIRDRKTNKERVATHAEFDEAFMAETKHSIPPMAVALQQAGYRHIPSSDNNNDVSPSTIPKLKIKLLSHDATMPQRATTDAAGLDMYSSQPITIAPNTQQLIQTGIAMEIPKGQYGQLQIRSSLAFKHSIELKAGLIDSDYRGEIKILLYNNGPNDFSIQKGDRIAQMVINVCPQFELENSDELEDTERGIGGFGSTGKSDELEDTKRSNSEFESANKSTTPATISVLDANKYQDDYPTPTCNICLSSDPYNDIIPIKINNKGKHPTLGLILEESTDWKNRIIIKDCAKATPAARIHRWQGRMRNNTLLQIDSTKIRSIDDAEKYFAESNDTEFTLHVGQMEKHGIHHDEGIPMIYFDQLAMIGRHLSNIKYDKHDNDVINPPRQVKANVMIKMLEAYWTEGTIHAAKAQIPKAILPKNRQRGLKLTRNKLKKQENWNKWQESEFKQLDQYRDQDTFGMPCELPIGGNVLDLLWTYNIKDDGRLKA